MILHQISQKLPDVLVTLVLRYLRHLDLNHTLTGLSHQRCNWQVRWRRSYGCYVALDVVNHC